MTMREKARGAMFLASALLAPVACGAQPPPLPAPGDMKTIGLVGGTSWYSTVEYYRNINKAINDAYHNNTNPPLILYNLNQQRVHELQAHGDWGTIAAMLTDAVVHLRAAGAQAVIFCANTPHKVYGQVAQQAGVPILHIADATGVAIHRLGLKKVGLIGTLYTMEDGFIQDRLKERYGVDAITPSSPESRRELHRIIQQELALGLFKAKSKLFVLGQIEELRRRGAEGIVLGCTEFPLIIKAEDVALPVFDTTQLHSQMAVDFILGRTVDAQR